MKKLEDSKKTSLCHFATLMWQSGKGTMLRIHMPTDHDSVTDRMTFSYRLNDAFGIDIHY